MINKCPNCKVREKQKHWNSKWCKPCAKELRARPKGSLTAAQIRFAEKHRADMPFKEIARTLRVSTSNLKRSCRHVRFCFKNGKYKNNPKLVKSVVDYYFQYGKQKTIKRFPEINVKALVDRPEYYGIKRVYRQKRWTEKQIIEASKMAGLVSKEKQAKYFNRPGASGGSIQSLFIKRFKHSGGGVHGLPNYVAREILSPGFPEITLEKWSLRPRVRSQKKMTRRITLWCEMKPFLKRGLPKEIRMAVEQMTRFQKWLYKSKNPQKKIRKMLLQFQ